MKNLFLLTIYFLSLTMFGCVAHRAGVVQVDQNSGMIQFTGNWKNTEVHIDGSQPFLLNNNLFQLSTGNHKMKIYRDGSLVLKRMLFIDSNSRLEVKIP